MQKNNSFVKSALNGAIFGLFALIIFLGGLFGAQVFSETNGGKFGEILNKILSNNWDNSNNDGKVKNSEKLGGVSADKFVKGKSGKQCPENQCLAGFDNKGDFICR